MFDAMKTAHPGPVDPIPTVIPTPPEYQFASATGHRTLWIVFVLMALTSATLAGLSWKVPISRRLYHVLATTAAIIGTLSYFALATGQGTTLRCTGVRDHHKHVPDTPAHAVCRAVPWARYVDWTLGTPPLLVALCALAGVDGARTLLAVAADLVFKLAGLFAALGRERTPQRWGWYAIAWIAYLVVIWHVAVHGSRAVRGRGAGVSRTFGSLALFALVLWTIYPIVWAIAGGARRINVDSEILVYAVLDVLAKAGFGLWLVLSLRRVPDANIELGGYWTNGFASQGRIRIGDDDEGA